MPTDTALLRPAIILVLWTLAVLGLLLPRRFAAARAIGLGVDSFKHGDSAEVPDAARAVNRNIGNLFEYPVLFYVVCIIGYLTQAATPIMAGIAWAYVGLRMAHSIIQVSYNKVLHRAIVFGASQVVLASLAIGLARHIF